MAKPQKKTSGIWDLSDAKSRFSELVRLAQNEPQIVLVSGEPAGAFINEKDFALLKDLKQKRAGSLIDKLVKAAHDEGVTEKDLRELRTKPKKINLK